MKRRLFALICFLLPTTEGLVAAIVSQTFTGVTVANFLQPADLNTEYPAGTPWTLKVEWDDEAAPLALYDAQASYRLSKLTFTLQGKSGTWTTSSIPEKASFSLSAMGASQGLQFTSGWGPADHTNQKLGASQTGSINLVLEDPTGKALSRLEPVPTGVDLSAWSADTGLSYLKFYLNDGTQYLLGTIDGLGEVSIPEQPEISVYHAREELSDGRSLIRYKTLKMSDVGQSKKFVIRNSGQDTLEEIKLRVGGKHREDFIAKGLSKKSLAPGAKATFKVVFKPKAKGKRKAVVKIQSNDADENSFDVQLIGRGR